MKLFVKYRILCFAIVLLKFSVFASSAQVQYSDTTYKDSTQYALLAMKEQVKKWGPNDTIILPAVFYHNEIVNYKEEEMLWVSKLSPSKLSKYIAEWTRLRNAVYVTYPYDADRDCRSSD